MKHVAKKRIFDIHPYVPGKPIAEVKRELGLKDVIKLASNENPYGPSPKVVRAIIKEARQVHRYPDGGCFYLRRELSKRLKISPEQIIFGNGSDEILVLALRAFVGEGDEVVIAKPSFLIYELAALIEGAVVRSVPLNDFKYDLNGMAAVVTERTKVVFIGNPDNPAGTYVTQNELQGFIDRLRDDILIVIDEAYFDFVRSKDYPDSIAWVKQRKNILVTRTFSKMFGLAGLRIGYAVADKEVIDILNRIRDPFNINSVAQVAALACLQDGGYYRRVARLLEQQRKFLYQQLTKRGIRFIRSATNFILVDVKEGPSVARKLLKMGVIVRDMDAWGLSNFIRVTIGTAQENKRFITALGSVIN